LFKLIWIVQWPKNVKIMISVKFSFKRLCRFHPAPFFFGLKTFIFCIAFYLTWKKVQNKFALTLKKSRIFKKLSCLKFVRNNFSQLILFQKLNYKLWWIYITLFDFNINNFNWYIFHSVFICRCVVGVLSWVAEFFQLMIRHQAISNFVE